MGVAVLRAGRRPARRRGDRPAPAWRAPARPRAPAAPVVRDGARDSRSSAGPESAASSSRHHSSAVRPASCQRAASSSRACQAAHSRRFSKASGGGTAIGVAGRETAQRGAGQGPPDGIGQALGRQRARRHDGHHAALGQQRRAIGLLGLARRAEGHQDGAVGAAQGLDDGVVAGLRDRERRIGQQRGEVGPRRFDDDAVRRPCERRALGLRHVRTDQQAPCPIGQRRLRPRREGGVQQRRADRAAARRHDDVAAAFASPWWPLRADRAPRQSRCRAHAT